MDKENSVKESPNQPIQSKPDELVTVFPGLYGSPFEKISHE